MKKGIISGTFIDEITYDIPSSNWSREQWKKDLDYMSEIGIDTLIFIISLIDVKDTQPKKAFVVLVQFIRFKVPPISIKLPHP